MYFKHKNHVHDALLLRIPFGNLDSGLSIKIIVF